LRGAAWVEHRATIATLYVSLCVATLQLFSDHMKFVIMIIYDKSQTARVIFEVIILVVTFCFGICLN
jgi:hypothetical protein